MDNIGGYVPMSWDSIMANPYFQIVANSPNVNFKANTDKAAGTNNSESVSNTAANANDGAIPVAPQAQGASNGVTLGEGIFATTLIALGAYGIFKGYKSGFFEKALKSIRGKSSAAASSTTLKNLVAIKNGNNELKVLVPNQTKTFSGNKIQTGVQSYGIQTSVSGAKQAFNPQSSIINSFQVETSANKYTVIIKDGKITKVISALMKKDEDVLARLANAEAKSSDAELLERFKKIAEELAKDSKQVDKTILKDVANIRYSNKFGDDTLNMVMNKYGQTPELQSFRTLEQFDKTSEAVKSYVPAASEEVFVGDIVNKKGSLFNKKGVLVDGLGVIKCDEEIVSGTRCFFEGDKLVKIEEIVDGKPVEYLERSFRFKEFVKANKDAINQFKKDVFEDRIESKIPIGSIIGKI